MDVDWIVAACVGMLTSCYILNTAKVVIDFQCCMKPKADSYASGVYGAMPTDNLFPGKIWQLCVDQLRQPDWGTRIAVGEKSP
jgi:hypothetical protein